MLKCEVREGEGKVTRKEVTNIELIRAMWELVTNPLILLVVVVPSALGFVAGKLR